MRVSPGWSDVQLYDRTGVAVKPRSAVPGTLAHGPLSYVVPVPASSAAQAEGTAGPSGLGVLPFVCRRRQLLSERSQQRCGL